MQRVGEEVFRAPKAIYIKPFASRPPFAFSESRDSFGEGRYVEQEIFKSLRRVAIVGKRLEETLKDFRRQTTPSTPAFVIINDFEEEERLKEKLPKKKNKLNGLLKLSNWQIFH